jgi:5'-nucleotidase
MPRFLTVLASGALSAFATLAFAAPDVPVRLIGINDFHGNLEAGRLSLDLTDPEAAGPDAKPLKVPAGGAAALAGLIATLRAGAPNSLLLSAGDMIGAAPLPSTVFRHESTIEIMNRIGVDVQVTGNHEYDAGLAELKRIIKGGCAKSVGGSPPVSWAEGP